LNTLITCQGSKESQSETGVARDKRPRRYMEKIRFWLFMIKRKH